jgi:hypothetical protein
MQLAAWNYGVGSGIFTGIKDEKFRSDFTIPSQLTIAAIVAFGFPIMKLKGTAKNRLPLKELVYYEKYGNFWTQL